MPGTSISDEVSERMSYPPGMQGGYPPSGGSGPQPYGPQSTPPPSQPPRSPWSSPLVLLAIAIGVLVVIGAGVTAFALTRSSDADSAEAAPSASTTAPSASTSTHTVTSTVTGTAPQQGGSDGGQTTSVPTTTQEHSAPTVSGADWQGFLGGPRCNAAEDPAIVIGRTARSQVVICQVGSQTGRWYYKGLADGNNIEIGYPIKSGSAFVAENDSTTYTVSPSSLVIAKNGTVLADESMLEYWAAG